MTFRSPIFRKLLASAFLLIAITLVVGDFYLTRYTAHREVQSVEQRLEAEGRILGTEAAGTPRPQLEDWARQASERAHARVTLVDPQGVVLIGETKFFSRPSRNFILHETVPFSSSLSTRTLWPKGAKSA